MATRSSILAWEIPWMEEPGKLQSVGSQRDGHDWATHTHFSNFFKELFPSYLDGRAVWGRIDTWGDKKEAQAGFLVGRASARPLVGGIESGPSCGMQGPGGGGGLSYFWKACAIDLVVWPKASLQTSRWVWLRLLSHYCSCAGSWCTEILGAPFKSEVYPHGPEGRGVLQLSPLALNAKCSGGLFSWFEITGPGSLWGSRLSLLWEKLCNMITLQCESGRMGFNYSVSPPSPARLVVLSLYL